MPELPEVETIVRGLRRSVVGRTISRVRIDAPPKSITVSNSFGEEGLGAVLRGRKILRVDRRGKNILIGLSGQATLWAHLKMTGHFFLLPRSHPVGKHDLVLLDLGSHRKHEKPARFLQLRFNDYRRFGRLRLYSDDELWEQEGLRDLGPEPLAIREEDFVDLCRAHCRMIKPALLDQTFLAGLGNIYSDESLHHARIHPRRRTSSISERKLKDLHGHIQKVLRKAIRMRGASVDSYSGIDRDPGRFQEHLRAYNNEGRPCRFCGTKIVREKIGSRSAHFCPRCQRP
jgi:formamidopyrimidine-DNA glycosylase